MNNRAPILTICIPTYNREKYLKECLDSIIIQNAFNENDIEIIVSDNASIDNTLQLVQDYQTKYRNIKYFRNDENIGPVRNILKLPDYATGEYIWFLSDDDMMNSTSIAIILEVIKKENPGLILSRMYGFSDGDTIDLTKTNLDGRVVSLTGIEDFFQFLGEVKYDITPYLMAFSIFCFKREMFIRNREILMLEYGSDYQEILNNDYFPHSRIIFVPFGLQEKIIIFEKDLILVRGNNISWTFHFSICQDLLRLVKDLNLRYKMHKKTYKKLMNVYYYSVFSYIVINHFQKYMPKFLYNFFVDIGRKGIKLIRERRLKK